MDIGLQFSFLWQDNELFQIQVVAQNASFRGCADIYLSKGELVEMAELLNGFPSQATDVRTVELGAFGPLVAGGAVRLEFRVVDRAGNVELRTKIEADFRERDEAENAVMLFRFEPAALDDFVNGLRTLETTLNPAVLIRRDK